MNLNFKDPDDISKGKAHILQSGDTPCSRELILSVIPVIREAVDFSRFQKTDLIIVTEHSDADSG